MNVRSLIDDIEQTSLVTGKTTPDRFILLKWMNAELNELAAKMMDADYFYCHLDPVILCLTGQRAYGLPENFPENFARHAGSRLYRTAIWSGDQWCCKLDDGTKEALLNYESPPQFYSRNLRGESNGRPTYYTIMSVANGRRQLLVSPPPDDSLTYNIDGLYLPTDWQLKDQDSLPPIPANSQVLKYAVLRRLEPAIYGPQYQEAFGYLMLNMARNRVGQFIPTLGRSGKDEYTVSIRR